MKTPEKIYIHKGFTSNTPESGSWHKDNITGEWIEYVRSDIAKSEAEKMAKEFAEYIILFIQNGVIPELTSLLLACNINPDSSDLLKHAKYIINEYLTSRKAQK
jgi:hypothetical protein